MSIRKVSKGIRVLTACKHVYNNNTCVNSRSQICASYIAEDEESKVAVPYHQEKAGNYRQGRELATRKKKKDIVAECDIAPSTLSTILKNKDKLQAKHAIASDTKKRHRDPTHLEVDAALFQWFTAARL